MMVAKAIPHRQKYVLWFLGHDVIKAPLSFDQSYKDVQEMALPAAVHGIISIDSLFKFHKSNQHTESAL
jgi:hypothetical protein